MVFLPLGEPFRCQKGSQDLRLACVSGSAPTGGHFLITYENRPKRVADSRKAARVTSELVTRAMTDCDSGSAVLRLRRIGASAPNPARGR